MVAPNYIGQRHDSNLNLEAKAEYERVKKDVFSYIMKAGHAKSPNTISPEKIGYLVPGIEIRVCDDGHIRTAFIVLNGECPVPGRTYTIEELFINYQSCEGFIKLKNFHGQWALNWFDNPETTISQRFMGTMFK